jgi:hypothetical protein
MELWLIGRRKKRWPPEKTGRIQSTVVMGGAGAMQRAMGRRSGALTLLAEFCWLNFVG